MAASPCTVSYVSEVEDVVAGTLRCDETAVAELLTLGASLAVPVDVFRDVCRWCVRMSLSSLPRVSKMAFISGSGSKERLSALVSTVSGL